MRKTKAFTAALAVLLTGLIFAQPLSTAEASTIRVSGGGAVAVTPDFATVRLGVRTDNEDPQLALLENNSIVANVLEAVMAAGIDEDDIVTANFAIFGSFGTGALWDTIIGYRVNNTVVVTIRDMELIGDVLGAGVAAGANVSDGIAFGIRDSANAYSQALALAVHDATTRAQAIAGALGVNIIGIASVTEMHGVHTPVAQRATMGGSPSLGMAMAAEAAWGVPIEVTDLSVTARVEIVFLVGPYPADE